VPQAPGAPPPGELEGSPLSAAEFVLCDHTINLSSKAMKESLRIKSLLGPAENAVMTDDPDWLRLRSTPAHTREASKSNVVPEV
jgi:hypothetical protein